MQIYRSLLTFFSSLSSSRYFKVPNSTQQQKKTYHKAIKQSQTVYEQSPNHLVRHHGPRPIKVSGVRSTKVTHFQVLVIRGGAGKDTERKDRRLETDTLPNVSCYFGGARSKGFATLRNVSKLQFFDKIGQAKSVGFRFYSAI